LKDIDHFPPLQVDANGPIIAAFAPSPIVDARDPNSGLRTKHGHAPLQMMTLGLALVGLKNWGNAHIEFKRKSLSRSSQLQSFLGSPCEYCMVASEKRRSDHDELNCLTQERRTQNSFS